MHWPRSEWGGARASVGVQGYLAHKKPRPPRTLPQDNALGSRGVLGGAQILMSKVPLQEESSSFVETVSTLVLVGTRVNRPILGTSVDYSGFVDFSIMPRNEKNAADEVTRSDGWSSAPRHSPTVRSSGGACPYSSYSKVYSVIYDSGSVPE